MPCRGEEETLARVAADLELGRLSMARQRLRGLVGSQPQRLDLREQLADLYRREGLLGQAGRWSYLSETVDPIELRAFEREYSRIPFIECGPWAGAPAKTPPENACGSDSQLCVRKPSKRRDASFRGRRRRRIISRPRPGETHSSQPPRLLCSACCCSGASPSSSKESKYSAGSATETS